LETYSNTSTTPCIVPQILSNKIGIHYDVKQNNLYSIVIDKLTLNLVTITPEFEFDNYIIKQYPQRAGYYIINDSVSLKRNPKRIEKNFLYTFSIYIDGEQIGELSTDCRTPNATKLIKLSFSNRLFYCIENELLWYTCFKSITEALELKLHNISYLEIAFDSYNLFHPYRERFLNSTISFQEGYKPVNKVTVSSLRNHSEFIVGCGKKVIAIYPKSPEIEKNDKCYITNYHRAKGLDTLEQIDRVELRVKNEYLKKYNIKLEDLNKQGGIEAIFKLFTENSLSFFDLSTKRFDTNRNIKYNRLDLIDYSIFDTKVLFEKEVHHLPTSAAGPEVSTQSLKNSYKQLLYLFIDTGKQEYYNALEAFISSPETYLTQTPYECYFGSMDLKGTNRTAYMELTEKYLKQYDHAPTPEVLNRLETFVDLFFYGFNPNDVLIEDENADYPF
jgi:hypothetical protein